MEEKERMEKKERLKEDILEKLEKLKEELKKTGEKTAEEFSVTLEEIGRDWEFLAKDFTKFFKETIERPQVKDAISRTKNWLAFTLKSTADALLKLGREIDGLYESGEEAAAGTYECIRCGARYEHGGGKLHQCAKCGGTTFRQVK